LRHASSLNIYEEKYSFNNLNYGPVWPSLFLSLCKRLMQYKLDFMQMLVMCNINIIILVYKIKSVW
jgi:hypothetical protein